MVPADSAPRAGTMPKASRDRSLGTLAKNMRTCLISAFSAIIVGFFAYVAGGYFTAKRLARDTNYAQLMWLTNIDRDLQEGRIDRARKITHLATDGTLMLLGNLDRQPLPILMTVAGAFDMKKQNEIVATRAKQHFIPLSPAFSKESVSFLEQIKEVEIPPSTCAAKNKTES